jgi:rubrerythrin
MRRIRSNFLIIAAIAVVFSGCQRKADKTIENLKAAFKGETTASAKYAAFSDKATAEGYKEIAVLFKAASEAEKIHAANHSMALESLGSKADEVKPEYEVKSTKENLEAAIKGEEYEFSTMYPGFVEVAKTEKASKAIVSFEEAMQVEKNHHTLYQNALKALNEKTVSSLPAAYFVCPRCGNTYDAATAPEKCGICMTSKSKFQKIS